MDAQDTTILTLARTVGPLIEHEPGDIAPDANLFELGLDSIAVMQMVSRWRRDGIDVSFTDLAASPTLATWAHLVDHNGAAPAAEHAAPGGAPDDGEPFELALMQRAYWVGRDEAQALGGVAAHLYTEFDAAAPDDGRPAVDPDRLRPAFDAVVARHDTLRLVVTDDGRQRIAPQAGWRGLVVHDLRRLSPAEVDEHLAALRHRRSHQVLAIESGEVLSADLSLLPGGATRLHLDIDMVAADAVSYRILLGDLAAAYEDGVSELDPVGTTFRAYCAQRPAARRAVRERARAWWHERLDDLPEAPVLPLVDVTPGTPPRVERRSFVLPPDQRNGLTDAVRSRGLTPAATLAAAFAEVVGHWSAEPRFLLNVPLFDRAPVHPDIGQVVGDFSSSVMLAIDRTAPATVAERATEVQARLHTDAAHADHSGVEVLRDLTRRRARQVLAPVVFTSALSLGDLFGPAVRRHFGAPVWIISQGPQVLLDAQITELDGGLLVNWDTREERFVPGVLDVMFGAFEELVHALAADGPSWDRPATDRFPAVDPPRPVALMPAPPAPAAPVAPRTALERVVAGVWSRVLGTDELGVDDELIASGGDSILAAAIVTELRDLLDVSVTIRTLFAAPTVALLAERLLADDPDPARLEQAAEIVLEIEAMSDDEVTAAMGEVEP